MSRYSTRSTNSVSSLSTTVSIGSPVDNEKGVVEDEELSVTLASTQNLRFHENNGVGDGVEVPEIDPLI